MRQHWCCLRTATAWMRHSTAWAANTCGAPDHANAVVMQHPRLARVVHIGPVSLQASPRTSSTGAHTRMTHHTTASLMHHHRWGGGLRNSWPPASSAASQGACGGGWSQTGTLYTRALLDNITAAHASIRCKGCCAHDSFDTLPDTAAD